MAQGSAHFSGLSGGFSTTKQLVLAVAVAHLGFGAAFAIGTSIQTASASGVLRLTRLCTR
ncbi:hypothetical protein E1161_22795 [Saccharopolyspora aridisoli]|uniref:Uncharacterized protein n=1 Tax=Saccharopolyspora aridisoli TaxID=2530385 RepID=A0A4R4UJD0_9PSEU|nr:hypothetical protein E1161_22795 [Saccharopolyspora aridisoli]